MQSKAPYNEKCQRHGLWELYFTDGSQNLYYKGHHINGDRYGYCEWPELNHKHYYAI